MSKIYKGLAYSAFSQNISHVISIASTVVIARLLTPDELGIFAIAATINLMTAQLKAFGTGTYLVREKELNLMTVRNALGLSILISWSLGLLLLFSSSFIAQYYAKHDIGLLIKVLSLGFFLTPHTSIGEALMIRDFFFGRIFAARLTGQIIQFSLVVVFIIAGYSYFSIAYAAAIGATVELIIVIFLRTKDFVFFPKFNNLKSLFKFGVYTTAAGLLDRTSSHLSDLIIGKLGTSAEVAYFSRGLGFLSFITTTVESTVRPVITPYLADKNRDGSSVGKSYLFASKLIGALAIPALAVAGYASTPIIEVFFGHQWGRSAELVTILCYWAVIRFVHVLTPPLFIIYRLEKFLFWKEVFIAINYAIVIYSFFPFGLKAIAFGMIGVAIVNFIIVSILQKSFINLTFKEQFSNILPNIYITIFCVSWAVLVDYLINFKSINAFYSVAVLCPSTIVVWYFSLIFTKHPLLQEIIIMIQKIKQGISAKILKQDI